MNRGGVVPSSSAARVIRSRSSSTRSSSSTSRSSGSQPSAHPSIEHVIIEPAIIESADIDRSLALAALPAFWSLASGSLMGLRTCAPRSPPIMASVKQPQRATVLERPANVATPEPMPIEPAALAAGLPSDLERSAMH